MSKTLVAYFSTSGVTARLAEKVAKVVNGDLYEIVPAKPYTAADLDWTNDKSRSSVEMKNKSFRPEISGKAENMSDYDTIYLGFPIWWYVAPTIVNTFLESYDLSGKTIIPFATSGSSGMGGTNAELKNSCRGAILKEGKRYSSDATEKEIETWVKGFSK